MAQEARDYIDGRGVVAQTLGLHYYSVSNPRSCDVRIEDIANALANICRFGGHVRRFYSVAEHSVNVSRCVPKNVALWGLLHDASEAYVQDLPSPLKSLLPEYKAIELRHHIAIAERFGLPWPMPKEVKDADRRCLIVERDVLLGGEAFPWGVGADGHPECKVVGHAPIHARRLFLDRFKELTDERV